MPTNPIGQVVVGFCLLVLVLLALIAIICLVVGPRHWTRRTCAITAGAAGLILLGLTVVVVVELTDAILIRGWQPEDEFILLPLFFPILPLLGEYLALKAIHHWRLRERQPPE